MRGRRALGWLRPIVFRAPVLGFVIAGVVAAVVHATTRPGPLPRGRIVAAACGWDGRDVVVTGAVRNPGPSDADFEVRPTFWVVGLGVRGAREATFVHVPAGQERAWRYVHHSIAPRRSGMPIGRCFPSVLTVPGRGEGESERDD